MCIQILTGGSVKQTKIRNLVICRKINAMGQLSQCWVPYWLLVLSQEPRYVVKDLDLPTCQLGLSPCYVNNLSYCTSIFEAHIVPKLSLRIGENA